MFSSPTNSRSLARSEGQERTPDTLLRSIFSLSQDIIENAEVVTSQKKLAQRLASQTQQIVMALTGHLSGRADTDLDKDILKEMLQYENDLHHTAQDIARLVNREAKLVERTNNRSPSPEVPRSRSPPPVTGALKRVFNSVAGEFEIARCVERSDHALKVLIAHGVVPPAYDSPLTQVPEQIRLIIWPTNKPMWFA